MPLGRSLTLVALSLSILAAALPAAAGSETAPAAADPTAPAFAFEEVAPGVWAALRREPPGMGFDANSVFLVNEADVVVVDTHVTPASARASLAALRRVTDKPVTVVINTHWHDDHVLGNQVYRDAFPGVEFVAHAVAPEEMATVGAANRRQLLEAAPGIVEALKQRLAEGTGFDGAPLTDRQRASYAADAAWGERYLAAAPEVEVVPPTITVADRLTLHRGGRVIEVRHLGAGHTGADLVVHLPAEGIVVAGDLVAWPVPLVGSTSFPAAYEAALGELLALGASIVVPGHGPVLRDDAYPRLLHEMLVSLNAQAQAAVARGESLDEARRSVDLGDFRRRIAGDDEVLDALFSMYVVGPGVTNAYRDAAAAAPAASPE